MIVFKTISAFSHKNFKLNPNFTYPILQSHRGYVDGNWSENSIESVQRSNQLGYKMAEFDVQMTSDRHVVLFHDPFFKVGRQKRFVENTSLDEIQKIVKVTLLEDLLKWFVSSAGTDFKLNIEIKSKGILKFELEKEVLKLIRFYKVENRIVISSFNPFTLAYFNANSPKIFRAFLLTFERKLHNNVFVKRGILNFAAEPNALHLRYQDWKPKQWKHLVDLGIPIALWTCNDATKAQNFLNQGVSSIITDKIKPNDL